MATVVTTGFSVSALLRAVWPTGTAKHAARVAKISHRTVEDWLADRCAPNAKTLIAMAQADDRLNAELISILTKRPQTDVPTVDEGVPFVDRRQGSGPSCGFDQNGQLGPRQS